MRKKERNEHKGGAGGGGEFLAKIFGDSGGLNLFSSVSTLAVFFVSSLHE